jgi:hypothetical protein
MYGKVVAMNLNQVVRQGLPRLAERLHDDCFEAHRGAFWWDEERRIAVAFGNDGADERQNFEIASVRKLLADHGGVELGFARHGDDGYSFALACELPETFGPDVMEGVLWKAWNTISSHKKEDPVPAALDWDAIGRMLGEQKRHPPESVFAAIQGDIAHVVLERNGLL